MAGVWLVHAQLMTRMLGGCSLPQFAVSISHMQAAMSLAGKIYLITGSSDGIGLHTATRLAGTGATVLVHGRCAVKDAETVQSICAHREPSAAACMDDELARFRRAVHRGVCS